MLRALFLALSGARGLQRLALRHPVLRRAALRFVAGEHLPDALAVIRRLSATGLHVTLDSLGEGVTSAGKAEASAQAYLEILDALHREAVESHLSLKLTQVGLDLSDALAGALLRRILDRAGETFVRIDMESSRYTDRTLALFEQLWRTATGTWGW